MSGMLAYLREASASLLVQWIRAMRRPQTIERATSTDLALFFINIKCSREGPEAYKMKCKSTKNRLSLKQTALRNAKMVVVLVVDRVGLL